MLKRLRVRFICIIMSIVTVMLSAVMITVVHFTQSNLEAESLRIMESIASDPMQLGGFRESGEEMLPYFALQIGRFNEVLAINGGYFDLSDEDVVQDLIRQTLYAEEAVGELEEYNLRYCRRVSPNRCCIVFADMTAEQRTVTQVYRACAAIGSVSFVMFLLLSFLFAWWAVKPVEKSWKEQRQFVSDASHELKTPLTVILTNAELLQQPDYDEEKKNGFAANILTMAGQMRSLVENLLDLARVDNGLAKKVWARVDLSHMVYDALLPFEPVYFEKGLDLQSRIQENIFINGSESHLRQVVEILLDNARKYSDCPAAVVVCMQRQGRGQCLLSVANPGAPIPSKDLQNIFKRFYRVDQARSRDGSHGLGLPIAEGIVRDHNGRIWATSQNGFNTFYVTLPMI